MISGYNEKVPKILATKKLKVVKWIYYSGHEKLDPNYQVMVCSQLIKHFK